MQTSDFNKSIAELLEHIEKIIEPIPAPTETQVNNGIAKILDVLEQDKKQP